MPSRTTPSLLTFLRSQWDRVTGYTCIAAGAVCMVVGAIQISRSPSILSQLSYIASAGLIGLFLTIVGVGLLITADLHDEWRKLDRIEIAIRQRGAAAGSPGAAETSGGTERPAFWRTVPAAVLRPVPVGLAAVGALGLAGGFLRTSRTLDLDHAFQGVAVSATGLMALALAAAVILAALRRNVGGRTAGALAGWAAFPAATGVEAAAPTRSDALVLVAELRRYHRSSCPAVTGLASVPLDPRDVNEGIRPCGICDPAGHWSSAEAGR